jgi:hypothetical protein
LATKALIHKTATIQEIIKTFLMKIHDYRVGTSGPYHWLCRNPKTTLSNQSFL